MPAETDLDPDIASLLVPFTRSLYRTMRTASPTCSFLEMKTLAIISERKSPSMKDIADELGISSPAATAIIDRLIEDKSIARSEDKNDRRMTRVSMTPSGKKGFEKTRDVLYAAINARMSVLTGTEQAELARILKKLQDPQ